MSTDLTVLYETHILFCSGKDKTVPSAHTLKMYGVVETWLHIFLTFESDANEWSPSRPCYFTLQTGNSYLARPYCQSGNGCEVNNLSP
jgi:hypothetical protein